MSTIYMVTKYAKCGFDTIRHNVAAFSASGAAWEWIVAQPDNVSTGTGPSANYDVLPYEVDALVPKPAPRPTLREVRS